MKGGIERVGRREGAMGMNLLEGEVWLVLAGCGAGWMGVSAVE